MRPVPRLRPAGRLIPSPPPPAGMPALNPVLAARVRAIRWERVNSSNVDSVGYDEAFGRLYAVFLGGACYVYSDVPPDVWAALLAAASKGAFFYDVVRGAAGRRGPAAKGTLDAVYPCDGPFAGVMPDFYAGR